MEKVRKPKPCPPISSAKSARTPAGTYSQRKLNLHYQPAQAFSRDRQLRHRGSIEDHSVLSASEQHHRLRHHQQGRTSIGDADSGTGSNGLDPSRSLLPAWPHLRHRRDLPSVGVAGASTVEQGLNLPDPIFLWHRERHAPV